MVLVNNAATHGVMFDDNACTTPTPSSPTRLRCHAGLDVVCQANPMHSFAMQDAVTYEYGLSRSRVSWLPPLPNTHPGELGAGPVRR